MTLVTTTITTVLSEDMTFVFQVQSRPVVMITTQDDTTALTAVSAVGTTIRVVLHMLQVHASFSAFSRTAIYLYVIYEIRFHQSLHRCHQKYDPAHQDH